MKVKVLLDILEELNDIGYGDFEIKLDCKNNNTLCEVKCQSSTEGTGEVWLADWLTEL